ncbi:MAG: hypothetical protein ABIL06_14545 [Pseudomonadota bacterium]|jgi:predicted nucleic acid-binding protein
MKGRIVCNTGPMIAFAIVDRLDLLSKIFHEVVVPDAVHNEILDGGTEFLGLAAT